MARCMMIETRVEGTPLVVVLAIVFLGTREKRGNLNSCYAQMGRTGPKRVGWQSGLQSISNFFADIQIQISFDEDWEAGQADFWISDARAPRQRGGDEILKRRGCAHKDQAAR